LADRSLLAATRKVGLPLGVAPDQLELILEQHPECTPLVAAGQLAQQLERAAVTEQRLGDASLALPRDRRLLVQPLA